MKIKNQKQSQNICNQKPSLDAYEIDPNKIGESYRSYFFRTPQQKSDCSPCQSSQTNTTQKTKSRTKDTRMKIRNSNQISSELQLTQKSQIQKLRDENVRLKQTITELQLANLYQINEEKVKELLIEIQDMRKQIKKAYRDIENLKLQNDFLIRSNMQLKIQISKIHKISEEMKISTIKKSIGKNSILVNGGRGNNLGEMMLEKREKNVDYCGYNLEERVDTIEQDKQKSTRNDSLSKYLKNRRQKSNSLARIKSERNLAQNRRMYEQIKQESRNFLTQH